jgi:hypothetical protein
MPLKVFTIFATIKEYDANKVNVAKSLKKKKINFVLHELKKIELIKRGQSGVSHHCTTY